MYLVVKTHVPQALKNKVENIGVCVCIQSEVKPLVPPRRRHQRRKSNQVFLYGVVMPQGLEHSVGVTVEVSSTFLKCI